MGAQSWRKQAHGVATKDTVEESSLQLLVLGVSTLCPAQSGKRNPDQGHSPGTSNGCALGTWGQALLKVRMWGVGVSEPSPPRPGWAPASEVPGIIVEGVGEGKRPQGGPSRQRSHRAPRPPGTLRPDRAQTTPGGWESRDPPAGSHWEGAQSRREAEMLRSA